MKGVGISKKIDDDIIRAYFYDYIYLVYFDLKNDKRKIRVLGERIEKNTDQILSLTQNFYEEFQKSVLTNTHPDDYEEVAREVSLENVRTRLRHQKTFKLYYRRKYDEKYLYTRLKFMKVEETDEEVNTLIVSCMEVDEEQKLKMEKENERKCAYSMIGALSREYASVYYVNLDTGEMVVQTMSNRIEGMFGDSFTRMNYDEAVQTYLATAVHEDEKQMMEKLLSRGYVKNELLTKEYYTKTYLNNTEKYCEMKVVKVQTDDDSNCAVLGFAEKDKEIREEIEDQKQKDFQLSLMDGLAREYHSVFLIEPNHMIYLYRSTGSKGVKEFVDSERKYDIYDEGMNSYIDKYVTPEDRERIRKAVQFDVLMKKVPEDGIYIVTYKKVDGDQESYNQMCFLKAMGVDDDINIVLAFRNVDAVIREKMKNREILQIAMKERDMDSLCGIQNRNCFERKTKEYPKKAFKWISCIYMDLDGLHELNNRLGHDKGDEMLKFVAAEVTKRWGRIDTFRTGGDEFIIFLFDKKESLLEKDIEEFKGVLKNASYRASVGHARVKKSELDVAALLRTAELNLYEEKKRHYLERGLDWYQARQQVIAEDTEELGKKNE